MTRRVEIDRRRKGVRKPNVHDWSPEHTAILAPYIASHLPAGVVRTLADQTGRTVEAVRAKMLAMRKDAGVRLNLPRANLTPERVAAIQARAASGETVASIVRATGINRKRIEYLTQHQRAALAPVVAPAPVAPLRDDGPLPVGHPVSWGPITAGTVLDGVGCQR